MRIKILTLILLIPVIVHGHTNSPDSIDVRIYNAGQHYIKTYSISIDNRDYLFKDIPKGEYSNSIKLPFIWSYNKTDLTVIVKQIIKYDKWITQLSMPIDHVGDTKYTSGRFTIIVTTKYKKGELAFKEFIKKE
jgi:hypothetical protein